MPRGTRIATHKSNVRNKKQTLLQSLGCSESEVVEYVKIAKNFRSGRYKVTEEDNEWSPLVDLFASFPILDESRHPENRGQLAEMIKSGKQIISFLRGWDRRKEVVKKEASCNSKKIEPGSARGKRNASGEKVNDGRMCASSLQHTTHVGSGGANSAHGNDEDVLRKYKQTRNKKTKKL